MRRRGRRFRIIWTLVPLSIAVVVAVTAFAVGIPVRRPIPKPVRHAMVRKPVPTPPPGLFQPKEAQLDFFIVARAKQKKDIVGFRLVFNLPTEDSLDAFSKNKVQLRDQIYRFLITQHPEKNAFRYWRGYITKDLVTYLNDKYPKLAIRSILVDRFERL